jgi:ankyrin repeat protein
MRAAAENDVTTLQKFVEGGTSPDLIHPISGHSLLQIACETNSLCSIEFLLKQGANPNKKFTRVSRVSGTAMCKDATALMYVESVEAAKLLIEAGAEVTLKDSYGKSAIDWAKEDGLVPLVSYYETLQNKNS